MAGAIGAFAMVYKLFFGALASARNGLGEDQGKKQFVNHGKGTGDCHKPERNGCIGAANNEQEIRDN